MGINCDCIIYDWNYTHNLNRKLELRTFPNATGTVNTDETYEMPGLDIKDFVGTVLHWSNAIEVLAYEEYVEEYKPKT